PRKEPRTAPARARQEANAVLAQLARFTAADARGEGTIEFASGRTLDVSNLGKIFFPKPKFTKGDLMAYYAAVSPALLPAIADRPLVLKRSRHGVPGESFYQQKAPEEAPASVRVELVSDEGLTPQRRLVGGDLPSL